jgi:DNA repair exonuclease SbcCD ATPase subunit
VRKGKELQRRLAVAEAAQTTDAEKQPGSEANGTVSDASVQQLQQEYAQLAQRLQQTEAERDALQQSQQRALSDLQRQQLLDERQRSQDAAQQHDATRREADDLRSAAAEADARLEQQRRQSEAALVQAHEDADALQRQLQQLKDRQQAGEAAAPGPALHAADGQVTALNARVAQLEASLIDAQAQQHAQEQQQQRPASDAAKAVQRAAAAEATAAALRSEVDMMQSDCTLSVEHLHDILAVQTSMTRHGHCCTTSWGKTAQAVCALCNTCSTWGLCPPSGAAGTLSGGCRVGRGSKGAGRCCRGAPQPRPCKG